MDKNSSVKNTMYHGRTMIGPREVTTHKRGFLLIMNLNRPIKILYGSSNPIYIQLPPGESSFTKACNNTSTMPAKPKKANPAPSKSMSLPISC